MQYSPRNAIMYVSMVDAGTVELLREFGKTIVSSSDLVSHFEAVLSAERIATHYEAQKVIDGVLMEGFREIGRRVRPAHGGAGGNDRVRHGWLAFGGAPAGWSGLGEFAGCRGEREHLGLALRGDRSGDEDESAKAILC